jgi:hypothetical protein
MWRVVRLTLMWLLAVALPLQGLSAATMLACGVGQHEHTISEVDSHPHGGEGVAVHTHTHVADASQHEHADVDHSDPGQTGLHGGGVHKCSACASCCVSAVVPTQAISFDPVKLTDFFAPLAARTVATFVPEGLERPPRLFLA